MNHGSFAVIDNDRKLPKVKGRKTQSFDLWNFPDGGGHYFSNFPPFHVSQSLTSLHSTTYER